MLLKRAGRVHALLALLITTAFVVMAMSLMPSLAQENGGEEEEPLLPTANIDPKAKGSITIHKYANPKTPTGLANNGSEVTENINADPLEGVQFSVQKITNLNLAVVNGGDWDKVSGLKIDSDVACGAIIDDGPPRVDAILSDDLVPTDPDKGEKVATDANGVLKVEKLDVGAYLVCETADSGNNNIVAKAAPFIVVIPMPNPADDKEWLYDVHVYPKNSVTDITKEVDDTKAFKVGDIVNWTIRVVIPNLPDTEESFKSFKVIDQLDPRLEYVVGNEQVLINDTELKSDSLNDYSVVVEGNSVTFTLEQSGRAIAYNNQGEELIIIIKTKVKSAATDDPDYLDGVIVNKALTNINEVYIDPAENTTKWGRLNLLKHVKGDETKPLQGAEFTVQPKTSAGTECIADDFATTNKPVIKVITNNSGVAVYQEGDYKGEPVDLKIGDYCVRETKAPAGYVLPDKNEPKNWIKVTINAGTTTTANANIPVPNDKPDFPELPITGSATQIALTLGGIAVLLTAIGVGFYNTRLRRADN